MSRQQKDIKSKKKSNISKLINGIFFTKTWIYQKFAQSSLFIHFHIKKIRANNTWTFSRSKNQITHHFHHPSENHSLAPTPGSKHKKNHKTTITEHHRNFEQRLHRVIRRHTTIRELFPGALFAEYETINYNARGSPLSNINRDSTRVPGGHWVSMPVYLPSK